MAPVTVLLSGGIDSAALVYYFSQKLSMPTAAIFVDYGQAAAAREREAAFEIGRRFAIEVREVRVEGYAFSAGAIPGRNALLVLLALMGADYRTGHIALGIHSGTQYSDCSAAFVRSMQAVLDLYSDGAVRVLAPFASWTKRQVWELLSEAHGTRQLTYSCETRADRPCGICLSCHDIDALNAC